MGLITGLLVLWVVLAVVGFAVKSMLWLAIVVLLDPEGNEWCLVNSTRG